MDLLYATTSHLEALRDWTEDAMPDDVDGHDLATYADQVPPTAVAPFILLELSRPEPLVALGGPPMAGDQWSALTVIARCVGKVPGQASRMGDFLRWRYIGRAASGEYFLPMTDLGGSPVTRRSSGLDLVPDFAGGAPQVSESFTFELGRGPDDDL